MATSEFGTLPREILLVVGKPYMITSNIDVVDGLGNGTAGTLKLCNRQAAGNDHAYPKRLWLHFDVSTTGRITRARSKRAVEEATRNGPAPSPYTSLRAARAPRSCIRVRTDHPQKLVYVALSRFTDINNLYLTNSSGDHCFHHRDANADKNMADEFVRLQKHNLDTDSKKCYKLFRTRCLATKHHASRRALSRHSKFINTTQCTRNIAPSGHRDQGTWSSQRILDAVAVQQLLLLPPGAEQGMQKCSRRTLRWDR
ncbi:hypothetical protein ISCGN_011200 [Ixodes scapularis]